MSAYGLFTFWLVIMLVIAAVGPYAGFYAGVPDYVSGGGGSWFTQLWGQVSGSVSFLWDMATFQVPGMPAIFSMLFLCMNLCMAFVVVRLVRGAA